MPDVLPLDPGLLARVHRDAGAGRWAVSANAFAAALSGALRKAFGDAQPGVAETEAYLRGLHLTDLALACGCAEGSEVAWQQFIDTYRPVLYRSADALEPGGGARELADGLYAELFGVGDTRVKASLFRYYHGRSSLATWLRAVLAQRHVDRLRARRRTEPLPEAESAHELSAPALPPTPERGRFLALMQAALAFAIGVLLPQDRLRLSCYYARQMTLAQIGRLLGEHEATVSRHVARSRRELRVSVEQYLRERGMGEGEIGECFSSLAADPGDLDLQVLLGSKGTPDESRKILPAGRSTGGTV